MNNFKRILIIALCSILCVCAIPQFSLKSEAAEAATFALRQSILYMTSYLSSRGYSIAHEYGSSIPSISELKDMTLDQMGKLRWSIADKLNTFGQTHDLPDAGDKFIAATEIALRTGALVLSPSLRQTIDWWLSDSVSNGSVNVGSIEGDISDFAYDPGYNFYFKTWQGDNYNFSFDSSALCIGRFHQSTPVNGAIFVPLSIDSFVYNALSNTYTFYPSYSNQYMSKTSVQFNGSTYSVCNCWPYNNLNFNCFVVPTTDSSFETILLNYLNGQYETYDKGDLVVSQITDTSTSELLTSTNTIASDGTVEGDTTIYFPNESTLETAIDGYNQGTISYEDFLKIFGINSVASDATVQEKEDALTVVVSPSADYLWFTQTQWGAEAIEETRKASASTRAEEDSLADSIANTANGGSDPEDPDNKSRGKGLLALLLLGLGIWNTPIIAGDGTPSGGGTDDDSGDGSGDTSGYLAESIAGMAVAGSLVDDLFDSAGGSNGYGLIYTVGASFVIFSVIIGAANYFGALFHGSDTKQNIKASGKKYTPGKEKKGG